jgi:hypothetical protein
MAYAGSGAMGIIAEKVGKRASKSKKPYIKSSPLGRGGSFT